MAEKKGFNLAAALGAVSNLDTGRTDGREQIEYIHISKLVPDPNNFYTLEGVSELATNIELVGLQQPLRVRPDPDNQDSFVVVSGHRRRAAIQHLVDEGREDLAEVPCIVEREDISPALRELRLIYANSDTRRMSSADLSQQAERVEMLLYELKEEGMEFPGRMRDHVAAACKISASKLARLKVIREKLAPELMEYWKREDIREATAYTLAQQPLELQRKLIEYAEANRYRRTPDTWWGSEVENWVKQIKALDSIACGATSGGCENRENMARKLVSELYLNGSNCEKGGCCKGCNYLATCKFACPQFADQIAKLKAQAKAERKAEAEKLADLERPTIERLTNLWRRFGEARAAAGLSVKEWFEALHWIYHDEDTALYEKQERGKGIKSNMTLPYGYSVRASDVKQMVELADLLGVSLDYLFCRTDDPHGGIHPGVGAQAEGTE